MCDLLWSERDLIVPTATMTIYLAYFSGWSTAELLSLIIATRYAYFSCLSIVDTNFNAAYWIGYHYITRITGYSYGMLLIVESIFPKCNNKLHILSRQRVYGDVCQRGGRQIHGIDLSYLPTITIDIKRLLDTGTADNNSRYPSIIIVNVNE